VKATAMRLLRPPLADAPPICTGWGACTTTLNLLCQKYEAIGKEKEFAEEHSDIILAYDGMELEA